MTPASVARPITPATEGGPLQPTSVQRPDPDPSTGVPDLRIARLIAGVVPGRVDFSTVGEPAPMPSESIPMYRRPADRHAAATAVNAGRLIDLRG